MGGRLGGLARALFYAGLADKDQTLDALNQMAPLGPMRVGLALNSPEFNLLRGDSRVKALRQQAQSSLLFECGLKRINAIPDIRPSASA